MNKKDSHEKRYTKTVAFLKKHIDEGARVLDLGVASNLSRRMNEHGYVVSNTQGENLDIDYQEYLDYEVDVVTAFEIFEHMLAPFNILRQLKTKKLVASVPMKLWFSNAHWNDDNEWDKHYHEFERRQFNLLLARSGWKIIDSEQWISAKWKLGIRPVLRYFVPRHYIVYCERG